MVTDAQVRKLWSLLANGKTLALAARKTGMDEKTARKYRDTESLPSQTKTPRKQTRLFSSRSAAKPMRKASWTKCFAAGGGSVTG